MFLKYLSDSVFLDFVQVCHPSFIFCEKKYCNFELSQEFFCTEKPARLRSHASQKKNRIISTNSHITFEVRTSLCYRIGSCKKFPSQKQAFSEWIYFHQDRLGVWCHWAWVTRSHLMKWNYLLNQWITTTNYVSC